VCLHLLGSQHMYKLVAARMENQGHIRVHVADSMLEPRALLDLGQHAWVMHQPRSAPTN